MNRIKKFFISTFLTGVCIVLSVPVFAGNTQNNKRITADDIYRKLGFIERKVIFESTEQILNSLSLVFMVLKSVEKNLDFMQKDLLSNQFEKVLHQLKISNIEEQKMYNDLVSGVKRLSVPNTPESLSSRCFCGYGLQSEELFKVPPTPKIMPKKFIGDISELVRLSSIGTEELRFFGI